MTKYSKRIAIRIQSEHRELIEQLIQKEQFKSLSHVMRTALREFLSMNCKRSDCCASE
jgi:Arc/MetJ-type ribon-helix-helix transcriptional regulator